jgi:uncharacterized alkaline shock family protein YloU
MPIKKSTNYGEIKISDEAIATLAGNAVNESYGVVGMTSKNPIKDGYNALLKKENYSKGVVIKNKNNILSIDLYVIICYGVKISEVVSSIQQRVKYELENFLNVDIESVNVYVEGVMVNE